MRKNIEILRRKTISIVNTKGFDYKMYTSCHELYNKHWLDENWYGVTDDTIHNVVIRYVSAVVVLKSDDLREVTFNELSKCYATIIMVMFPSERLFTGYSSDAFIGAYHDRNKKDFNHWM